MCGSMCPHPSHIILLHTVTCTSTQAGASTAALTHLGRDLALLVVCVCVCVCRPGGSTFSLVRPNLIDTTTPTP